MCHCSHDRVRVADSSGLPSPFTGGGVLTPNGKFVVITRGRSYKCPREITMISTATNKIVADLLRKREGAAQTVAVTPDGKFAYAAIFGYKGPGGVWVVNLVTHKSVKVIATPDPSNVGTAVSPDGRFVIATDFGIGEVSIISTANRIIANVKVGKEPNGVVFSADSREAFVANQGGTTVSVIAIPSGHFRHG